MHGLTLSPKHGVNSSRSVCRYCGEDKPEVLLCGLLDPDDLQAPTRAVWNTEPCPSCAELSRAGIVCIAVRNGDERELDPCRLGYRIVVPPDTIRALVPDAETIIKERFVLVPETLWRSAGFPAEDEN